jgi:hypothetical protein
MFIAAKRFGAGRQKDKIALILDTHEYQYRASLSDISGQDIAVHKGDPKTAIRQVRDWLNTCSTGSHSLPGGVHINKQYERFSEQIDAASSKMNLDTAELTYADMCRAIESWLKDNG